MYIFGVVVFAWALALTVFDIRFRRLPDYLTLPAAACAVGYVLFNGHFFGLWGLLWPVLYVIVALCIGGVGGGDIKLAIPLGIAIATCKGVFLVFVAIAVTSLITLVWGIFLRTTRRTRWRRDEGASASAKAHPPNGPGMLMAAALVLVTPV